MINMLKKDLEKRCAELEVFDKRCSQLEWIIQEIQWMARRYAHGRMTMAVDSYNEAIELAQELGMEFRPDTDGLVLAKDGMFDKKWFEAHKNNSVKFITEPAPKIEKNCGAWDDDDGC